MESAFAFPGARMVGGPGLLKNRNRRVRQQRVKPSASMAHSPCRQLGHRSRPQGPAPSRVFRTEPSQSQRRPQSATIYIFEIRRMTTRVMVTGGSGFIGSALVRLLVGEVGATVFNVISSPMLGTLAHFLRLRGIRDILS